MVASAHGKFFFNASKSYNIFCFYQQHMKFCCFNFGKYSSLLNFFPFIILQFVKKNDFINDFLVGLFLNLPQLEISLQYSEGVWVLCTLEVNIHTNICMFRWHNYSTDVCIMIYECTYDCRIWNILSQGFHLLHRIVMNVK